MHKRLSLLMVMAVMLLIAVTGCGQSAGSAAGFSGEDLYLTIEGAKYYLNADIETVIAALGDDYEYAEGRSCDYDGLDKTYIYETAEFYTWPMAEGDMINEIYTRNPSVTTSKDIAVGATKDEVLAAYGAECEDTGYQLIYKLPDEKPGSLGFDIENDVVTAICITAQTA